MRSIENATSSAVIGLPSWNLAPLRRVKVYCSPSGETCAFSASHITSLGGLSTQRTSESYMFSRVAMRPMSNTVCGSSVSYGLLLAVTMRLDRWAKLGCGSPAIRPVVRAAVPPSAVRRLIFMACLPVLLRVAYAQRGSNDR